VTKLPSLTAAERLVRAQWLKPTEDGLQAARRKLVRAMWRARRAGCQLRYTQLRALYRQVRTAQAAQDWQATPQELARRARNVQDPTQYDRETVQQHPGHSALLALSSPGPRYEEPAKPAPLGRTRTRLVHDQFSGKERREGERRARQFAEGYYQALRAWETRPGDVIEIPRSKSGSDGRMRPVVGNWSSRPLEVRYQQVVMPGRHVEEGTLALLVNINDTLSDIREGRTLATLVDPRGGWHPNKARAVTLAREVLIMAFNLGDQRAHEHLRHMPVAAIQ